MPSFAQVKETMSFFIVIARRGQSPRRNNPENERFIKRLYSLVFFVGKKHFLLAKTGKYGNK
jgi:hypothetical protein